MNKNHYFAVAIGAGFLFLVSLGHIFMGHDSWDDFKTPTGMGEIIVELGITGGVALASLGVGLKKE